MFHMLVECFRLPLYVKGHPDHVEYPVLPLINNSKDNRKIADPIRLTNHVEEEIRVDITMNIAKIALINTDIILCDILNDQSIF